MDMPSGSALIISEGQARNLLRSHPGDGLEAWIAEQLWEPREDGLAGRGGPGRVAVPHRRSAGPGGAGRCPCS